MPVAAVSERARKKERESVRERKRKREGGGGATAVTNREIQQGPRLFNRPVRGLLQAVKNSLFDE